MKRYIVIIMTMVAIAAWTFPVTAYEVKGVDIHGFISQGYMNSSDNYFHSDSKSGTFEFNDLGINFTKNLTDNLRVGLQLFSRDLGDNGNNDINLDWAYGDYRWKDWLGVRVGKIKTPQGLYNETRDVGMLRNSIFLPQSIYPEILRDAALALNGAGIYGNIDMGAFGNLAYQAMRGTQNIKANETTSQALQGLSTSATFVANDSFDVDNKYAFSLVWDTPLEGLRFSGTYNSVKLMVNSHITEELLGSPAGTYIGREIEKMENNVISIEYIWGNLVLMSEYIFSKKKQRLIFDTTPFNWETTKSDGWYVGFAYRYTDWFELGSYYSESYNNKDDRHGTSTMYDPYHRAFSKDFALTLRFDVNDYMIVKLEGHQIDGTNGLSSIDNPIVSELKKDWRLFAAKIAYSF